MNIQPNSGRLPSVVRWGLVAVAAGLLSIFLGSGPLSRLEYASEDLLFALRNQVAPASAPARTIIVAVDDASFTQSSLRWPWPRDYMATIIRRIAADKPAVIGIDITLTEPSEPTKDADLGEAIAAAGNVVVVNNISASTQNGITLNQLNHPIPEVETAVASLGLTSFDWDTDGVVRHQLAFQSHNGELYYSWAMQAVRLYDGVTGFDVLSRDLVRIGPREVHLQGQYLHINYRGPASTIPTISAYQVADSLIPPGYFTGKIVLLGVTSETLHDSYPTPFGSQPPMPGVEVNANAIETILQGDFVTITPSLLAALITLIAAIAGIVLAVRLESRRALVAVVIAAAVWVVLCAGAFIAIRLILPVVIPIVGLVLSFGSGISIQLYNEQINRAQVRSLFERYVAPAAIDQMLTQPDLYASGGQRKELTILFSDIRGFTTLSENLAPDDVVAILNAYLARMTDLIFEHGGTIDKFEGDAILAIWNAPLPTADHATKAVQCAQAMIVALDELAAAWAEKSTAPLQIGIGINTGQAFVGNIGSARRMDYTVIGDTVNLASRLQDLTKSEGVPILFGETTRDLLNSTIPARFVATTQVKGRAQPVNVYTVSGSE